MFYFMQFLIYALPVAAVVLFVVSLVRYIRAVRANRRASDTYDKWQMTSRLVWLIVSSVIMGALVLSVVGIAVLLMTAVAFM